MFWLADRWGMTRAELGRRISAREVIWWKAYFMIRDKLDAHEAVAASKGMRRGRRR